MDISKLEQLCALKEKHLITDKEFEESKQKLMSSANDIDATPIIAWSCYITLSYFALQFWTFLCCMYFDINNKFFVLLACLGFIPIIYSMILDLLQKHYCKNSMSRKKIFVSTILGQYIGVFYTAYKFFQIKYGKSKKMKI